jgi:TetR/AcrR family transcriptional regulator, transcriptional repressor for nem operon
LRIFAAVSKAEQTRQFIIEKTAPLFNKKGFDGTTLSDLTKATGLTKGALYGNFRDKEEIGAEAFRYSIRKVKEGVRVHMAGAGSYKKQLTALLDFYAEYVFDPPIPGGCPLLNTAIEADDHHTSMRRVVAEELLSTTRFIEDLITQGIRTGEFKAEARAKELSYTFFCAVEGALMFSRVERSREPMDIIVKHCKKILDQISIA